MIRCDSCQGRIRPPERAWADSEAGVHFYRTWPPIEVYHKFLAELAKKVPFIHDACWEGLGKPSGMVVALNLSERLQYRHGGTRG
jgi:hypothetical protein